MIGRLAGVVALLAVAGALAGAAAPRASAPAAPDAQAFVKRLVVQMVRDDYARAWLTLHPAHKAVAPRWEYLYCELKSPIPGQIQSLDVIRVVDGTFSVPGVGSLRGKLVTFRLVLRGLGTIEHTSHIVSVHGGWRWILTPERYQLYRANGCGGSGLKA
jgi:hypothetical protein